jgi:hypothetical protein
MTLLTVAGEVGLTPCVNLMFVTPEATQKHLYCFGGTIQPILCLCTVKPKETNKLAYTLGDFIKKSIAEKT